MSEDFDPYRDTPLEGDERAYVETMRAAAMPDLMPMLVAQAEAFAAAARRHYEARDEEDDEREPIETRCLDNAAAWLDHMTKAAMTEAHHRQREREPVATVPTTGGPDAFAPKIAKAHARAIAATRREIGPKRVASLTEQDHAEDPRTIRCTRLLDAGGRELARVETRLDRSTSALTVHVVRSRQESRG